MRCESCGEGNQYGNTCDACGTVLKEEILIETPQYNNHRAVWNPKAIKLISIFCSLVPGCVLFSMNYARLEHPEKKKRILTVIGVTLLYFILVAITPSIKFINYLFIAVSVVISIYVANDQNKLYENHIQNGGKKASITIPLILSIFFVLIFLVLMILAIISQWENYR